MFSRKLLACALLGASVACASKQPVASSADESGAVTRDRTLITQADLEANPSLKAASVLDAIKSLRPQFFNDRGLQTIRIPGATQQDPDAGRVHASVNGGRIVDITDLAEMHANEIIEVRFLNAGQAMQKFGTAARQGPIILVTTAKQ